MLGLLGIFVSFPNKHLWPKWCASRRMGLQKWDTCMYIKRYIRAPGIFTDVLDSTWVLWLIISTQMVNGGFPNHWFFGVILQAICRCWAFVPIPADLLFIRTRQETRFAVQEIEKKQKKNITLAEQAIWKLVLRGTMPSKHCEMQKFCLFCVSNPF